MSEFKPEPYIGVSGIATSEQHEKIFSFSERKKLGRFGHFVMVGVQATNKTQILEIENKRGRMWHPVGDEITQASYNDETGLTRPYIHCFFEDDKELEYGLNIIMDRASSYCRGLQINGLHWLDKDYRPVLDRFLDSYPDQSIIIQANSSILDKYSPKEVAQTLKTMPVDYVLLDPSGGFGIKMDMKSIQPYVDEIYQQQINVGVGIAGGLEAANLEELFGPLVEVYADLSCDAEGRFRKGLNGQTVINLDAVEDYLKKWEDIQGKKYQ